MPSMATVCMYSPIGMFEVWLIKNAKHGHSLHVFTHSLRLDVGAVPQGVMYLGVSHQPGATGN
jgi:hypothetical protein